VSAHQISSHVDSNCSRLQGIPSRETAAVLSPSTLSQPIQRVLHWLSQSGFYYFSTWKNNSFSRGTQLHRVNYLIWSLLFVIFLLTSYYNYPFAGEARLNTKNSVRTAKKTPHFTVTKINRLTLFKEIIAIYTETHTKHINTRSTIKDLQQLVYTVTASLWKANNRSE
jgi:hypothetical protein